MSLDPARPQRARISFLVHALEPPVLPGPDQSNANGWFSLGIGAPPWARQVRMRGCHRFVSQIGRRGVIRRAPTEGKSVEQFKQIKQSRLFGCLIDDQSRANAVKAFGGALSTELPSCRDDQSLSDVVLLLSSRFWLWLRPVVGGSSKCRQPTGQLSRHERGGSHLSAAPM